MQLIVLYSLIVAASCSPYTKPQLHPTRSNIIGGKNATAGEFPYQLSLQDTAFGFRFHFCGASIYNENWGISAAQCFQGEDVEDPSNIVAVAGEIVLDVIEEHQQTIHLSQFIQHEEFDGFTYNNDIAVFKVAEPFVFDDFVQPLDLPPADHAATGDCLISGWGSTKEGGPASNILLKATLPVVTDKECYLVYGQRLEDGMICAGIPEGGIGTCTADTGGPLVCSDIGSPYLAGIVSWSYGCGQPETPDVFCEVACYVDWIKSHIS